MAKRTLSTGENFSFYFILIILTLLTFFPPVLDAKWVSLGFDDPWNEGLFRGEKSIAVVGFELDSNKNPHLFISYRSDKIYLYWDGEKWRGLEGIEPTKLRFPEGAGSKEMRLDSKDRPHFVYSVRVDDKINTLNYVFWDGEKWSEPVEVLRTNKDIDDYYLNGDIAFTLDRNDNPHIVYTVRPTVFNPERSYCYLRYGYLEDGEWKSLGDGDRGKGVFKELADYNPQFPKIRLDSRGFPHILCGVNLGTDPDAPVVKAYTFWDGEKWAGIDGSHTPAGLPDSYVEHHIAGLTRHYFYIDSEDVVHFVYPSGSIIGQGSIYYKWDGERWSNLLDEDGFSVLEDEPNLANFYTPSFNEVNTLSFLADRPLHWLRYHYWNGSTWAGLGGTDQGSGLIPTTTSEHEFLANVAGIAYHEYPSSYIFLPVHKNFHYPDRTYITYYIAVLRWEEEVVPTVELYVDDFKHALSSEKVEKIIINGRLHNPFESETNVNIIVAMLTPAGDILYFPAWSEGYREIPVTLPAGFALPWTELLTFPLPSELPPIDQAGTYYFGEHIISEYFCKIP